MFVFITKRTKHKILKKIKTTEVWWLGLKIKPCTKNVEKIERKESYIICSIKGGKLKEEN